MVLRLYNTLTRTKEDFAPLDPKNVRMYVCGPTVYDFAHIGNARPVIVFDVLFRLLRHLYGETHVTYVRNVTDVDDKINARAAETAAAKGISVEQARAELTAATEKQYNDDVGALGNLPPTHTPRATAYIQQMVAMIERLVRAGHAYASEGHVLYRVASKADYGKLSRRSLDDMIAGARVDVAPYKEDPMDFVLWKPSTPDLPGWDSPWGRGRPGWHIECSAMSDALLGETFDIHGGGIDLIFPHHENEIAQSEGAHAGHAPARVWMHNGFLQVEGEKMSKSLGNFVTIREMLRGWNGRAWSGSAIRLTMLKTHYRQPISWSLSELEQSNSELRHWAATVSRFRDTNQLQETCEPSEEILAAVADDLNTPEVVSVLRRQHQFATKGDAQCASQLLADLSFFKLIRADLLRAYIQGTGGYSKGPSEHFLKAHPFAENLKVALLNDDVEFQRSLGRELQALNFEMLVRENGKTFLREIEVASDDPIADLIQEREEARKAKNWKESDRIRDELLAKGVQLKDNPDGTTSWEVKR